jgi:TPR repeat protein
MHEGVCYQNGTGVAADQKRAVALFTEAANKGDKRALTILGMCRSTSALK